jgi:hypothetical protein
MTATTPPIHPTIPTASTTDAPFTRWVRAHRLLTFAVLAYGLSWAYWLPLVLTGQIVRLGSAVSHSPRCWAR